MNFINLIVNFMILRSTGNFFIYFYIQNYSELLIFEVVIKELVQVAIQTVDATEISFGSVNIYIISVSFRSGVYISKKNHSFLLLAQPLVLFLHFHFVTAVFSFNGTSLSVFITSLFTPFSLSSIRNLLGEYGHLKDQE